MSASELFEEELKRIQDKYKDKYDENKPSAFYDPRKSCAYGVLRLNGSDSIQNICRVYSDDYVLEKKHYRRKIKIKENDKHDDYDLNHYKIIKGKFEDVFVGKIEGTNKEVNIRIQYLTIDGYNIATYYPIGKYIDHDLIEAWIKTKWAGTKEIINGDNFSGIYRNIIKAKKDNIQPDEKDVFGILGCDGEETINNLIYTYSEQYRLTYKHFNKNKPTTNAKRNYYYELIRTNNYKINTGHTGYYLYVGKIEGTNKTVHINLGYITIDGYYVATYYPSGKYVDLDLIENWINKNMWNLSNILHSNMKDIQNLFSSLKSFKVNANLEPLNPMRREQETGFEHWYFTSYLKNGEFASSHTLHCFSICEGIDKGWERIHIPSHEHQILVRHVYNDRIKANKMIEEIEYNKDAPFEKDVICTLNNVEYKFWRGDYIGRHLISISRNTDNLYITIGVGSKNKSNHDDEDSERKDMERSFYFVGTNGSLKDLSDAIKATKHLW